MFEVGDHIYIDGTQCKHFLNTLLYCLANNNLSTDNFSILMHSQPLDNLTHLLGAGGFGKVFATNGGGKDYAFKFFCADVENIEDAIHEITVLNRLPKNRLLLEVNIYIAFIFKNYLFLFKNDYNIYI